MHLLNAICGTKTPYWEHLNNIFWFYFTQFNAECKSTTETTVFFTGTSHFFLFKERIE